MKIDLFALNYPFAHTDIPEHRVPDETKLTDYKVGFT